MNRLQFITSCGKFCLGSLFLGGLMESCGTTKVVNATLSGSDLVVPLHEFEVQNASGKTFKKFVVVHHHQLQYPLCVYRKDENNYRALLMKCTHQGVELQAFGDKLQCPAHGSEFDSKGVPSEGPASEPLRTFATRIEATDLKITLR